MILYRLNNIIHGVDIGMIRLTKSLYNMLCNFIQDDTLYRIFN